MAIWLEPLALVALGYLLGSLPFGLLLTRLSGAGDIRNIGSGNIGATNVLRTGRKGLAAMTLLLDVGKGAAAAVIGATINENLAVLAGMGAVLGHLYPVWLKFRGGKGVATLLGVALGLNLYIGLLFAGVWLGALAIWRYSSVSGMLAATSVPIGTLLFGSAAWAPFFVAIALLIIWKHRANIERLLDHREPKVGKAT